MNSYEFRARRKQQGLLITVHIGGRRPGIPFLRPEISPDPTIRVYRLHYRPATGAEIDNGAFDHLEQSPRDEWRTLRILLPRGHEYLIHSRAA